MLLTQILNFHVSNTWLSSPETRPRFTTLHYKGSKFLTIDSRFEVSNLGPLPGPFTIQRLVHGSRPWIARLIGFSHNRHGPSSLTLESSLDFEYHHSASSLRFQTLDHKRKIIMRAL
ncbi:hypothetical protein AMTR_s00156p00039090 [Amborella trichopoda]|uniref:Uncharacterized protein n=1 Tax=Amborella trichopoda TaxID=13333 RepID=W1PKM5_AMBTC|nr:hypothetical protein AMTR_s00156p00039090 [Amborella trichopoda]